MLNDQDVLINSQSRHQARFHTIVKMIAFLLIIFGVTLIVPLMVSVISSDGLLTSFGLSAMLLCGLGTFLFYRTQHFQSNNLRARDGFLIVTIIWITLSLLGAIPFILAVLFTELDFSLVDIIFETVSGLTTTGATTLIGLDELPTSLLFYRQWLQWLGGIGVVVIAVAIMPLLGIGGAQIYKAETPGPFKDARIAPKISDTAKLLFFVYLLLTVLCGVVLYWAGMSAFDAMMHALTTIATGGFSNHDASIGYYDSNVIKFWITVFMILGGISFALHFNVLFKRKQFLYWRDEETRCFLLMVFFFTVLCTTVLVLRTDHNLIDGFIDSAFHVVSFMTSTGYTADSISEWPIFLEVFLFLIAAIGGCQGSSAGGIKVVRVILFFKQGRREIRRLIHLQGVFLIRLNGRYLSDNIMGAILGFLALYVLAFIVFMSIFLLLDHDLITSFSMTASSLNNTGPGLGEISNNYVNIDGLTKILNAFAMVLGRLEIFTLLVLLSPHYWKR